jgi:dephospho-CoA kinase
MTVGLTGGIASGKSMVAACFVALGVPLIDTDQIAREVVAPGSEGLAAIAAGFGPGFLQPDGALDRRRMREHVFGNEPARRMLESITHPLIRARIAEWRQAQTHPYHIIASAIMPGAQMLRMIDRTLVIDVPVALQLLRLTARDGVSPELAQQMLAAQPGRGERLTHADDVLENVGAPQHLGAQVRRLDRLYRAV